MPYYLYLSIMTADEKRNYKKTLHQQAVDILKQRIATTQRSMENAQASANNEEKSSAGDKYETSRAMSHLEKDMHAKQLAANNRELAALMSIDCDKLYQSVVSGSVVVCKAITFFIAAGLGKISGDQQDIYFLSPAAPIAKLLFNKVTGDTFVFNHEQKMIEDVY